MKVLLSWIFDHINADFDAINVEKLVYRFNQTTAEIEHWMPIDLPLDTLFLAHVTAINQKNITVHCPELNQSLELSYRSDVADGDWYLIKKDTSSYRWATSSDFSHAKEFLLPSVTASESDQSGAWKKNMAKRDYIFDVDNKSITHRPDLWSHRGMAREIAAFMELPFADLEPMLAQIPIKETSDSKDQFSLAIQDPLRCKRLAGLYVDSIENKPSILKQALRLALVDAKPINALVDATNYVMLDIGQPMHAFDAQNLPSKTIQARTAHPKESLTLLDGTAIELTDQDLIIADGGKPVALAGIMGGAATAVKLSTSSAFLEAACFDATTIRHSSARHKIRTEASARFEKSLDPNQNTTALLRCVALLQENTIPCTIKGNIISLGAAARPKILTVSHQEIEHKLGVCLESSFIITTLERLGFSVELSDREYRITVPTARSTKDITINEDIVEEIGRFYGYSAIHPVLPYKQVQINDLYPVMMVRNIKHHAAFALRMHEVATYALFDEQFLAQVQWEPENCVTVKNPVSDNWRRLVTSLVPHLCKAVVQNCNEHDMLRFFEVARSWKLNHGVQERKGMAGIFYEKHKPIDFYESKNQVNSLMAALGIEVSWTQEENPPAAWYMPYQTACLKVNDTVIGYAGMSNPNFFARVAEGQAFIFELDMQALLDKKPGVHTFKPLSKYPEVQRDISILIADSWQAAALQERIHLADTAISSVVLVDFFAKKEWQNQKSLTFRFTITNDEKTLTKIEVDTIYDKVADALKACGATIR